MKTKYSLIGSTLLLCATVLTVGCSGSGGSSSSGGGTGGGGAVSAATTTVSGTTGTGTSGAGTSSVFGAQGAEATPTTDSTAVLRVDKNADGALDESDYIYSIPVLSDGSFSFDGVVVDETKPTKAQLTVAKEGFSPIVRTITLTKDTPFSIFADIGTKPILTEVIDLTDVNKTNTFLQFGISATQSGVSSFSKLMTLSELKANADLGEGTLTQASIPASAFGDDVKSVTVKMQAFDSTKAGDIEHFPGAFTGHGKPSIGTSATDDETENALESAAFDLLALTDQNGDAIELQMASPSKLLTQADATTCGGMYWVRRVGTDQAAVIEAWGDDDNNASNGFQVPIWSNDNATGTWAYVGEADWDSSNGQFSICVDEKWQGYLNCDSLINVGQAPKQLCIYSKDQFGNVIDGFTYRAKKGTTYSYGHAYSDKATLSLANGTPDDWSVSYRGAITSWNDVGVDSSSFATSTTDGCDYDLNVTVDNPYSAQVKVFAVDDDNKTVANVYVTLRSKTYSDYYTKGAYTNTEGYAIFEVKPNVVYTAGYIAGTSLVNVNGSIVAPETADSGRYASVEVKDQSVAPTLYMGVRGRVKDNSESLSFDINAYDINKDTLTLTSFKMGAVSLVEGTDYNIIHTSSYGGRLSLRGVLDLNSSALSSITPSSLSAGSYTLSATVNDGKLSTTATKNFQVVANRAPTIGSLNLVDAQYNYYYANSAISTGDYSLYYYVYDGDGDSVTKTMKIDDVDYTPNTVTTLSSGEHNVSIVANDGVLESSKTTTVFVGNRAPIIRSAGATSYLVDINSNANKFKLFAYVTDAENAPLTVTATDEANVTYTMAQANGYGSKYISGDIALSAAKAENVFSIVASDGEDNSTASTVTVETIAGNQDPIFITVPTDAQVNVNTEQTLECVAEDPEGTAVSYVWTLNGTTLSETSTTFTKTFTTTGSNTISCTATDEDGGHSTADATILVIDPTQSGTLTVHALYEGLIVSVHNSATYEITSKKFTDANGVATFNVTGGRVTFSVTAWAGMEIHKKMTMDLIKPETISTAYYNCEDNTSIDTECTTADWCAMMEADNIPTWVWDAQADETKPTAASIDTNSDGSISQTELYAKAKELFDGQDGNNDEKLTYEELLAGIHGGNNDYKRTIQEVFANVPVREYYMYLEQFSGGFQNYSAQSSEASEQVGLEECYGSNESIHSTLSVDYSSSIQATAADGTNKNLQVTGSGYAAAYSQKPDENHTISMNLGTYRATDDGNYSYMIKEKDNDTQVMRLYFLADQTKQQVEANLSVDAANFVRPDTNVTFVNNEGVDMTLTGYYKGLFISNYIAADDGDGNKYTSTKTFYNPAGFVYHLRTSAAGGTKTTYNYYGDGTLQSSYNIGDYPFLDVAIAINKDDGSWTLSGDDKNKLTVVGMDYEAYSSKKDANSNPINYGLMMSIHWTVVPSQMPSVELVDVIPSEAFADANNSVSGDNVYEYLTVEAEEYKGQTETSLLDLLAGNGSTYDSGDDLYNVGMRKVYNSHDSHGGASNVSANSQESTSSRRHNSMFSLRLRPSSASAK